MHDNRLLIVDDNQDTCSNLSDILTDCGYSVDVAYRGSDGLDHQSKWRWTITTAGTML